MEKMKELDETKKRKRKNLENKETEQHQQKRKRTRKTETKTIGKKCNWFLFLGSNADIFSIIRKHLHALDIISLSELNKEFHASFNRYSKIWLKYMTGLDKDKDMLPLSLIKSIRAENPVQGNARALIDMYSNTGCQLCFKSRIRKVYLEFKVRACEECVRQHTITERELKVEFPSISETFYQDSVINHIPSRSIHGYKRGHGYYVFETYWKSHILPFLESLKQERISLLTVSQQHFPREDESVLKRFIDSHLSEKGLQRESVDVCITLLNEFLEKEKKKRALELEKAKKKQVLLLQKKLLLGLVTTHFKQTGYTLSNVAQFQTLQHCLDDLETRTETNLTDIDNLKEVKDFLSVEQQETFLKEIREELENKDIRAGKIAVSFPYTCVCGRSNLNSLQALNNHWNDKHNVF